MSDLPYGARYAGPSRSPAPPGGVGGTHAPAPAHAMRRNMSEGANLAGREHGAGAPGVGGGPSSPFFAAASGGSAAERAAGVSNTNYAAEAADAPLLHRTLSSDDLTPSVFVGAAPTVFLPKSKTSNSGSDLRDDIVDQGGDEEEDSRRRGAWQGGFGSPTKGGAYDAEDDFDFGQPDRFGQKFRMHGPQPCRDSFWAILFLLHLGFIFVLLIWGFVLQPESAACNPDDENPDHPCDPIEEAEKIEAAGGLTLKGTSGHHVLAIAASCCLVGIFLSFGYLMLVRKFARALIWVTLSLNILIWIGYSVFLLIFGQLIAAGIFLFISMIWIVFAFCWRRRIPFAAAMLTAVSATLESYPAPIYFAWGSLPVFVTWFIVWVSSFIAGERLQWVNGYFFWLFLLISLYWVAQVVKNVVHVTAAGTFASWYFFARPDAGASYTGRVPGMPANPTQAAFRRCITTSFGSVCQGSLVVAILQAMQTIARVARRQASSNNALARGVACCCECFLGLLSRLLQYFNLYAFSLVAIYGMSYWQSAKETMQLIKSHGIEAIINDDLISPVLTMGCIAGGMITGGVGGLIALSFGMTAYIFGCAVMGFLIGFIMMMVSMGVVESGVATIFVCFALDPEAMRRNNPTLYHQLTSTYELY